MIGPLNVVDETLEAPERIKTSLSIVQSDRVSGSEIPRGWNQQGVQLVQVDVNNSLNVFVALWCLDNVNQA